jgi:hypothetical protein
MNKGYQRLQRSDAQVKAPSYPREDFVKEITIWGTGLTLPEHCHLQGALRAPWLQSVVTAQQPPEHALYLHCIR